MNKKVIEVKTYLANLDYSKEIPPEILNDTRSSIKSAVKVYLNKKEKHIKLLKEYNDRKKFDLDNINQGYDYVLGIDEVGRGTLAGPLSIGFVLLSKENYIKDKLFEVRDSKKIPKIKHENLSNIIHEVASYVNIVDVEATDIDKYGISECFKKSIISEVKNIRTKFSNIKVLIDYVKIEEIKDSLSITKGDDKSICIASAAIVSKFHRDKLMKKLEKKYPGYNFINNVGYGTKNHISKIKESGIIEQVHRKSFTTQLILDKNINK